MLLEEFLKTLEVSPIDRTVQLMAVVKFRVNRGIGTIDDPHRIITQYWTLDGELLTEVDSI